MCRCVLTGCAPCDSSNAEPVVQSRQTPIQPPLRASHGPASPNDNGDGVDDKRNNINMEMCTQYNIYVGKNYIHNTHLRI